MKVMTVVGTRPELIRLARVIAKLETACDHVLVHTGQNYDPLLNEIFLTELEIKTPDVQFTPERTSLGSFVGSLLHNVELAIHEHRPDALLVLGDTNSCLAAYMARRLGVTVFHMEAGNRCWDLNVPEETNRRVVDHVSDFNLVYTEHARQNLLREGLHPRKIYLTGSPMREVLDHYERQISSSDVLTRLQLTAGGYFLASVHREESVDRPEILAQLVAAFEDLSVEYGLPVLVSTHPRTRKQLALAGITTSDRLTFAPPFGFFDYNALQQSAKCVISDSGTISEESIMLGFAAVSPRNAIERPEALDAGATILCGTTSAGIVGAVRRAIVTRTTDVAPSVPPEYAVPNTSERVVRLILGLTNLRGRWDGIGPDQSA